ncbi:hypothetical protein [Streptomyces cavernae]|uniref:hypothetical protein n=1 Tax=Streptomyces cavernae TaxID=2259034 RepID=UPI000FEB910A|nr:hypothetical protein [Streptomyces cavernae]
MPADEAIHGAEAQQPRARTGPRHAAPKKPLFTRIHMPAGKAMAIASMPTAIIMGMGFSTLARADDKPSSSPSLSIDEYQDCVEALDGTEDGKDASATPSPSASASESASEDSKDSDKDKDKDEDAADSPDTPTEPAPSASSGADSGSGSDAADDSGSSEDKTEPAPSATQGSSAASEPTAEANPAPAEGSGNVLEDIGKGLEELGKAIEDAFTPGDSETASASPTPSPSASAAEEAAEKAEDAEDTAEDAKDTAKDAADEPQKSIENEPDKAASAAAEEAEEEAEATPSPSASTSASPSPSESAGIDPDDCPAATDEEGGVEKIVALPDDPWYLDASSLLLKGADYKGVVKVKTANGTVKEALKFVISGGTDIGDLHQTVKDPMSGKTHHVQAAKGSTSTITDGDTVMYTEKISGNLFGLIPVTFSPEHPPPLNIPLIYFTNVKVTQAGQFGGTLHVPGLHQFTSG